MDKTPEGRQENRNLHQKLQSYIGVKYRALDAKVEVMKDFLGKVAAGDKFFE